MISLMESLLPEGFVQSESRDGEFDFRDGAIKRSIYAEASDHPGYEGKWSISVSLSCQAKYMPGVSPEAYEILCDGVVNGPDVWDAGGFVHERSFWSSNQEDEFEGAVASVALPWLERMGTLPKLIEVFEAALHGDIENGMDQYGRVFENWAGVAPKRRSKFHRNLSVLHELYGNQGKALDHLSSYREYLQERLISANKVMRKKHQEAIEMVELGLERLKSG